MTTTLAPAAPRPAAKPPLITRPLLVRFVSVAGSSVSFYLPLSVVPRYAAASGSDAGAGLATGALLLATVAAELATPRLVARVGYRLSLTVGLALLGAPALALLASSRLTVILAVSIVRGPGFAVTTVAGGALTVSLIPAGRRGEGLGLAARSRAGHPGDPGHPGRFWPRGADRAAYPGSGPSGRHLLRLAALIIPALLLTRREHLTH